MATPVRCGGADAASNGSTSCPMNASMPIVGGSPYDKPVRVTVLSVALVLALIGNSLLCMWMLKFWKKPRRRTNYFILNLTIADFLVTTVAILPQIILDSLDSVWYAGTGFCKVFKVAQTFSMTSSSYMLAAMAIDRHQAIVKPLSQPFRVRRLVGAAWAVALIPSLPCSLWFQVVMKSFDGQDEQPYCSSVFVQDKNGTADEQAEAYYKRIYLLLICVWVFIIPFVIICVAYTKMLVTIWRKAGCCLSLCECCQRSKASTTSGGSSYVLYCKGSSEKPGKLNAVQNSTIPRAKYKTLRMTIVIVLAFIIFNLPYYLITLIRLFGGRDVQELLQAHLSVMSVMQTTGPINSAVNPYIFLMFNLTMKQIQCCRSPPDSEVASVSGVHVAAKCTPANRSYDCRVYINGMSSKTVLSDAQAKDACLVKTEQASTSQFMAPAMPSD